jgi:excisionase family DNA binding protein
MEVTMADVALGILPDVWTHLNSPEAVKRRRGKAALEARLGYAEAAALLGLKVTTLRTLVHRGQIPHVRISPRRVRFDQAVLLLWLADRAQGGRV